MVKAPKRKTSIGKWTPSIEFRYGFAFRSEDKSCSTCCFCLLFGHEKKARVVVQNEGGDAKDGEPAKKRARTFRSRCTAKNHAAGQLKRHLTTLHPAKWAEYQKLVAEIEDDPARPRTSAQKLVSQTQMTALQKRARKDPTTRLYFDAEVKELVDGLFEK